MDRSDPKKEKPNFVSSVPEPRSPESYERMLHMSSALRNQISKGLLDEQPEFTDYSPSLLPTLREEFTRLSNVLSLFQSRYGKGVYRKMLHGEDYYGSTEKASPEEPLEDHGKTTPSMPSALQTLHESFYKITQQMNELFLQKSGEYNAVTGLHVYYPFKRVSVANGLNEKYQRYVNLLQDPNADVTDTLMDMAVISIMALIMEDSWK